MSSTISTIDNQDSLITRGLTLDIKSINNRLTKLFQRYLIAYNKVSGEDLFGTTQVHQLQDEIGLAKEYTQGSIVFTNNIDKLQYLIDHRDSVANVIGVSSKDIYSNRRDIGKMYEYIMRLDGRYEFGDSSKMMQMYISKNDAVVNNVSIQSDWVDYIMTQDWIDEFAKKSIDTAIKWDSINGNRSSDHRIDYIADIIQGMVKDHHNDYHKQLEDFDESIYINASKGDDFIDAYNKLTSFNKLNYGLYEIFKPIGGTTQKYLKVKLYTNGKLDIQGVIGLNDCKHVDWEYGSPEYLRSLNTGNQQYEFKLSIPFNDDDSSLWWKPDEKELLDVEKDDYGRPEDPVYGYYKTYETERFLRWFGTNYIPLFDLEDITKKTICSIPHLSNDIQSDSFYDDATNLTNADMSRANITYSTSLSLLNLAPKSSIEVFNKEDGQYLRFIVSGNQQTANLSFHIVGKMLPVVQEINHYGNTVSWANKIYNTIMNGVMFLDIARASNPSMTKIWELLHENEDFIPQSWMDILDILKNIVWSPTTVDLIRFRFIDFESIYNNIVETMGCGDFEFNETNDKRKYTTPGSRYQFVSDIAGYLDDINSSTDMKNEVWNRILNKQGFIFQDLDNYLNDVKELIEMSPNNSHYEILQTKIDAELTNIQVSQSVKDQMIKTLEYLYTDRQTMVWETTVDELRTRIETFNNLIVRLPTQTNTNKLTSRHIFLDWKYFVDNSLNYLTRQGLLFPISTDSNGDLLSGLGTDDVLHPYTEYYIDKDYTIPFIDYSYCIQDGQVLHDRWDYWSKDDFT